MTTEPTDRAVLRDSLLRTIDFALCNTLGYVTPEGLLAAYDTTLRAAALADAADALGRMDYDTDSNDYGYDTYRDAWNGGVMDGAEELRRLAAGAQQQPTIETQPPRYRWRVETRDGIADEWAPGTAYLNRHHAVGRYEALNEHHPMWKDGTPVERRIVRETTTYTVETPSARPEPMDPVHILGIDADEPAPVSPVEAAEREEQQRG